MAWQKGQSGNGGGSQKRRLITGHIERELLQAAKAGETTKARAIARKVVEMAEDGDRWAVQFVTERTEGRPDQHVSISSNIRELSDGDLANIAAGCGEGTASEADGEEVPARVH